MWSIEEDRATLISIPGQFWPATSSLLVLLIIITRVICSCIQHNMPFNINKTNIHRKYKKRLGTGYYTYDSSLSKKLKKHKIYLYIYIYSQGG